MTNRVFSWIEQDPCETAWIEEETLEQIERRELLIGAVRNALRALSGLERHVVERHNFEGRSFVQIADELVTSKSHVKAIHRRARKRLRKILAPFVKQRFGLRPRAGQCPICLSHYRRSAERVVRRRRPEESFAVVIKELRERFGIVVKSPKTIIGHVKYHF